MLLAFPGTAAATIRGGCTGTGTATSSTVDLTTATEWHVKKDDVGGGTGQSPSKVKSASVGASALGISIPIASGTSKDGETQGSVSGVSVSLFAALGARFVVSGSADNGCSGEITIIIDDVNPLLTLLGGGGLLIALLALLVVLAMTRGSSGLMRRLVDAFFGLIGGVGLSLALEQFGVLDPTELIGLLIAIGTAIIAFLTCGIFGGGKEAAPPPDNRWGDYASTPTSPGNPAGSGPAAEPTLPPTTEGNVNPPGAVGGGDTR
jgi:hypothetical protein